MKFYWKMVLGCALAVLVAGFALQWPAWGVSALFGTLLAGYGGTKIAPFVPKLREDHPRFVVAFIVLAALLQGAGGFWHVAVLWGMGLAGSLLLPLAGMVFDQREA